MKNFVDVFFKPYFAFNYKDSLLRNRVSLKNMQNLILNRKKEKNFVNDPAFF